MVKEIELTPYLENLLKQDIENKNRAQLEFDIHLKIVFETKGVKMPEGNFDVTIKDGKLIY